jgi:polyisoprenoid-binding protein YceI
VRKLGLYFVKGRFRDADGWVALDESGRPRRGEIEIQTASIGIGMPPRDWHLRTRDFLDARRYPVGRVRVEGVQPTGGELRMPAEFSVHGTVGSVQLRATCTPTTAHRCCI